MCLYHNLFYVSTNIFLSTKVLGINYSKLIKSDNGVILKKCINTFYDIKFINL